MSKANGAMGAVGKVITYILVVLLILGIAGGITYFFMRSQGMNFYVEYGGTKYLANGESGSIKLLNGTSSAFTVKSLTGEEVNYSVRVMSNGANNFSFTANGEIWYLWNDDETKDDYTDIFEVEKNADSGSVRTQIRKLDEEGAVMELARILGGSKITDQIIGSAREMKELAARNR